MHPTPSATLIGLFALAAALLGNTASVSAQAISYSRIQVGGPGGGPFEDTCRPNDVLIGFNYTAGKALNQIAGVCQAENNGALVGANYGLRTWGHWDNSGPYGATGNVRCPPGQAITSLHVWVDKFHEVHNVRATCSPLVGGGQGTYLNSTDNMGGQAFSDGSTPCPPLALAIGLTGGYGTLIDRLGLKCSTFPWYH